jgi:hypothetical protein
VIGSAVPSELLGSDSLIVLADKIEKPPNIKNKILNSVKDFFIV